VLNKGGILYTSKLPYDNEVLDKVSYTTYVIDDKVTPIRTPYQLTTEDISSSHICKSLYDFLLLPNIPYTVAYYLFQEQLAEFGKNQTITWDKIDQYTERYYVAEAEHEEINNVVNVLDSMNIKSSAIDAMFRFIEDNVNFTFESNKIFNEIFYDTDGLARNKSAYILSAIYDGNYSYIKTVKGLETFDIDTNAEILDEMKDTITNNIKSERYEGFLGIVEKFGMSLTLGRFNDFYTQLKIDVAAYSDEDHNYYRDVMLAILDSFDNIDILETMKYTEVAKTDDSLTSYMKITDGGR